MDAIDKLKGILYVMHQVEKDLTQLQRVYNDKKGNLEESNRMSGDIILNIECHITNVSRGEE